MNKGTAPKKSQTINGLKGMQAGAMPKLRFLDDSLSPAFLVILLYEIPINFDISYFSHPSPTAPLPLLSLLSFFLRTFSPSTHSFSTVVHPSIHSIIPFRASPPASCHNENYLHRDYEIQGCFSSRARINITGKQNIIWSWHNDIFEALHLHWLFHYILPRKG